MFQVSHFAFFLVAIFLFLMQAGARESKEPLVLGDGLARFQVGKLLASDDFENLDNWEVQVEPREGLPEASITANGLLDCFVPNRGATLWFKEKLKTRITISYEVVCPETDSKVKGLTPRDINNFWMASAPDGQDLFDSKIFTGAFPTYHKMNGYYASTGGGSKSAPNRTTRIRRYPREKNGEHCEHLFLNHRDGIEDFPITPGKAMTVQLVA